MEELVQYSWPTEIKSYVDNIFIWSGYAICVALLARLFIRPRAFCDPWAAFCLGVLSVSISSFLVRTFITKSDDFSPFNPACIGASVVVAIVVSALWLFVSFLSPEYDEARGYYGEDVGYENDSRAERRRDPRDDYDERDEREYREGRRRTRYDRDYDQRRNPRG